MERKHKEEILLLRIRNLIEQNNSLTCGIEETSPDHQQQDTEESAFLAQAIKLVEQNLHVNGYSVEQLSRDLCMERTGLYRKLVTCLLYTSDAADDLLCVSLGGHRILKKKKPV